MLLLYAVLSLSAPVPEADTMMMKYVMPEITMSAPLKQNGNYAAQPLSATTLDMPAIERMRITAPQGLSLFIPNMMYADYGAKMTSSIYIRGIGSRIDQPAMGLYVDNVPVINKNNYDFDYFDVAAIDILRGPQGTLYGRNTIGGVMDVRTLSPFEYQGTRIRAGYGNGNTSTAQVSTYHKPTERFAFSVALNHLYSDGFFTNIYDGSSADRILSESGRVRLQFRLTDRLMMENILSADWVRQNGFAYAMYDEATGTTLPINHNDPNKYRRFGLSEGVVFRYRLDNMMISSVTSYQFLDDEMTLDQDFTPASMFTITQSQRENAATQDFTARSTGTGRWQWVTGLSGFYRHLGMEAPVTFKKDGIEQLILGKTNAGIETAFPDMDPPPKLLFLEEQFPIGSNFRLPAGGASLYHQSTFSAGRWKFTAGARLDWEYTAIRYDSRAEINYRFTLTMPDYRPLLVELTGRRSKSFFEVMPKAAVMYETAVGNLYATVTRGYKAGGFNTQIFSDILQNHMMNAMQEDLGVYFGSGFTYDVDEAISYKPERSWNYEIGGHFARLGGRLTADAALFYIDCRNQQLTVFPPGTTTGRMMTNAGRTRSFGAEFAAAYRAGGFRTAVSYGYTNAKFLTFRSGDDDYSGNFVPYAPQNTVSLNCGYDWALSVRWLDGISLDAGWQGAGRIYWNEDNTVSQAFYGLLDASVSFRKAGWTVGAWTKNILSQDYNTFYFKSVQRSFVQKGKPFRIGFFLNVNI